MIAKKILFLLCFYWVFNFCIPSPGHCRRYAESCENNKPKEVSIITANQDLSIDDKILALALVLSNSCSCK